MSKIHYFQRYHQKEDMATNNAMLLFSRLYNESTYKFNEFLNSLIGTLDGGNSIDIGVNFSQQEKSSLSRPDGSISQKSFKVVIETKPNSGKNFGSKQLENHLESFSNESLKILVALSPTLIEDNLFNKIKLISAKKNVHFVRFTFKDIVEKFRDSIEKFNIELNNIIDEYEEYCVQEGLIKETEARIRIAPCGGSLDLNLEYGVYYMPSNRSVTEHGYFGVYNEKRVKAIGKIVNTIVAETSPVGEPISIKILKETNPLTAKQYENIIGIIKESRENLGWCLSNTPHSYTIVDKFIETNYIKESKGGIMGHRYQNLKDVLGVDKLPSDEKIAELLNNKKWK